MRALRPPSPWVHGAGSSTAPPQPSWLGSHPCSQGTCSRVTSSWRHPLLVSQPHTGDAWGSPAPRRAERQEQAGLVLPGSSMGARPLPAGWQEEWGLVQTKRCFQRAEINNTNPNLKLY